MQVEFHQLVLRYQALRIADPARQARMTASIAEAGQQSPVLVVGEPSQFVLVDGYCRVQAIKALRHEVVEALLLDLPEPEALLLAHRLDLSKPRSALEEGWFVQELHRSHGLSLADLSRRCGHSVSWLSRRLALVERLPDPIQDLVRRGKLAPHAAMKVLVPLARANAPHALRLATRAGELSERLSARQWEALYAAYRGANSEVRERLLEHPGLFARVDEERKRPDPPKRPEEGFLSDLEALSALSRRARRRLREVSSERFDPRFAPSVQATFSAARADFDSLQRLVTERFHDRPRDPDRDRAPSPGGPRSQNHCPSAGPVQEHGQTLPS